MFTPIRVAAVTAVLALTGTLALVSGPLAPTQPVGPGAESLVSMEPAHFTGTVDAWDMTATDLTVLPDRTIAQWRVGFLNAMSDPRTTGRGEAMDYLETIDGPDGSVVVTHSGHGRVSNDDGTWLLECHGVASAVEPGAQLFCWYDGEGGYDGLTAYTVLTRNESETFDAEGWIFAGERPLLLPYED